MNMDDKMDDLEQRKQEWHEFLESEVCKDVPLSGLCDELKRIRVARLAASLTADAGIVDNLAK